MHFYNFLFSPSKREEIKMQTYRQSFIFFLLTCLVCSVHVDAINCDCTNVRDGQKMSVNAKKKEKRNEKSDVRTKAKHEIDEKNNDWRNHGYCVNRHGQ